MRLAWPRFFLVLNSFPPIYPPILTRWYESLFFFLKKTGLTWSSTLVRNNLVLQSSPVLYVVRVLTSYIKTYGQGGNNTNVFSGFWTNVVLSLSRLPI